MNGLSDLEEAIGYRFRDASLLRHALTHPSYSNEMGDPKEASNQRLEFLGDAVLELVSSEFLFWQEPVLQEGEMTRLRASLVCERSLAVAARKLGLSACLRLGRGEAREGDQYRDSVLSDTLEAVLGAVFLDGGMEEAKAFIHRAILAGYEAGSPARDAKSLLQEYASRQRIAVSYALLEASGPDHRRHFKVAALLDGVQKGCGEGSSKKKAEQAAAEEVLREMRAGGENVFEIN